MGGSRERSKSNMLQSSLDEIKEDAMDSVLEDETSSKQAAYHGAGTASLKFSSDAVEVNMSHNRGINDSYYEHEAGDSDLDDEEIGMRRGRSSAVGAQGDKSTGGADVTWKDARIREEAIVELHPPQMADGQLSDDSQSRRSESDSQEDISATRKAAGERMTGKSTSSFPQRPRGLEYS